MGFANFKAILKKVNLKPKGVKEIVLEVSDGALAGKIDTLADMIDGRIDVSIDSEIVRYNVQINARTEKPIKSYRVDESGVVSEIKPEGEQVELDLGLPKEKQPIVDVPEEIDRRIVDDFVMELLAPTFEDLPYPFYAWISRIVEDGDSYTKLANEFDMAPGKISELIDEYRARIAPLAKKWDEWKQSKGELPKEPAESDPGDVTDEDQNDSVEDDSDEDSGSEQEESTEENLEQCGVDPLDPEDELEEWEREIMGEDDEQPADVTQDEKISDTVPVDLNTFILTQKPKFPEIEFDFPSLLERKKSGSTWTEIASSLKVTSGQLSAAWSKYKKLAQELRDNGAA